MQNISVQLENQPGSLALLGETLGKNGISLEGGGVFNCGETSVANFLVADGEAARAVLLIAGFKNILVSEVLVLKLRQGVPGQLGAFCRRLSESGVNIEVQYSDHANQLIIVPDDFEKGTKVAREWMVSNQAAINPASSH